MCDNTLLLELLQQTYEATQLVLKRFKPVLSVEYFTDTPAGMEKLDAICMVIIAIGESLKNIDKITDKKTVITVSPNRLAWSQRHARCYFSPIF